MESLWQGQGFSIVGMMCHRPDDYHIMFGTFSSVPECCYMQEVEIKYSDLPISKLVCFYIKIRIEIIVQTLLIIKIFSDITTVTNVNI